jgi:uncharacterized protein YjbI with pentapeptide repeats
MKIKNIYINDSSVFKDLKIDCGNCFGFCCVALYFSKVDGFPKDKSSGEPCVNLNSDFTCKVHKDLRKKGLKGCTSYDCFGAGQKVAKITYNGVNLRGADLSGALLIAADLSNNDLSGVNLIGADMRDTNIRGANLENSIFITQQQVNSANGDANTKLPASLTIPKHWSK